MNNSARKCILLSAAFFFGLPVYAQQAKEDFQHPPLMYRPIPFWHLNGELTKPEIDRQVADAGKAGFGGVAVLPVTAGKQHPTGLPTPGMSPEYLSEAYFERYGDILKAAKQNRLKVILYDDIDFPSGSAGGKLKALYPDATRKVLVKKDTLLQGPQLIKFRLPQGPIMALVASDVHNGRRTDLTAMAQNGYFKWNVPDGKWKIMLFSCENGDDAVVDFMDPVAIGKFISLTYAEYAKRFSSYFGNVITQTFYDDVGYVYKERGWTNRFNEKFKQRFGKDPAIYYPALWEDIGPETEAARVAFFDTRAELLAEGFPKVIADWDSRHGLKSSGHPPGNYEIQPVDMNFDIFKFYRHSHIPTMDAIFYHGHGREGYKLVSSAAAVYDRPVVASETYGAFLEKDFDVKLMYRTAMEIFARGINFLVPHGMWYDSRPQSVRIPPLVSPYSEKVGPALNRYNDFAARTSMMLQGGRTVSEIGVIYPIAALEGFYHFQAKDNKGVGNYAPRGTDYLLISDMLTNRLHRDFTFIHPELFASVKYQLIDQQVVLSNKVNRQRYQVMIIPGGKVISYPTLKKLQRFYNQGGKLIATTLLPSKSAEFGLDSGVQKIIREIFPGDTTGTIHTNRKGGMAVFIPRIDSGRLQSALDQMQHAPDVMFEDHPAPSSKNGALSYIHKIKDGRHIYYFANSTDDQVNTYVDLRGRIVPEIWDPYTGTKSRAGNYDYKNINGVVYTRVRLNLNAVQSIFILSK